MLFIFTVGQRKEVTAVIDWLFLWRLVPWINTHLHRMDKAVVLHSCLCTGNSHNGKISNSERFHLHMKYIQKPVCIFPNNVLLQSHEILHFVVISHWYKIFKCVSNVAILSLSCSWHRHVVVWDTCFSFAHHILTHISSSLFHIGSCLYVPSDRFCHISINHL